MGALLVAPLHIAPRHCQELKPGNKRDKTDGGGSPDLLSLCGDGGWSGRKGVSAWRGQA